LTLAWKCKSFAFLCYKDLHAQINASNRRENGKHREDSVLRRLWQMGNNPQLPEALPCREEVRQRGRFTRFEAFQEVQTGQCQPKMERDDQ